MYFTAKWCMPLRAHKNAEKVENVIFVHTDFFVFISVYKDMGTSGQFLESPGTALSRATF